MKGLKKTLMFATAAMVLGIWSSSAFGMATLSIDDGVNPAILTVDTDNDGFVSFNCNPMNPCTLSGWTANVTTGFTKPLIGSAGFPDMDLNSVETSSSGGGSLVIKWSDTDFNGLLPDPGFTMASGWTTQGTVQVQAYLGKDNALFSTDVLLADTGTQSGPGFFSMINGGATNVMGPYSLTMVTTITHQGSGTSSGDTQLHAVPEPGTMMLMGSGLLGLGLWRKFKK